MLRLLWGLLLSVDCWSFVEEAVPKIYLARLDPACLRDPARNYYATPEELDVVWSSALQSSTQVDLDFIEDAKESQDRVPVDVLSDIARGLSFTANAAADAETNRNGTLHGSSGNGSSGLQHIAPPVRFEYLPWLDLLLIHNTLGFEKLTFQKILAGIPCVEIGPAPDRHRRLSPDVDTAFIRQAEWTSQPRPTTPAALSPAALSPTALSPTVLSPTVLSPTVLSPAALSPAVLSPTVLSARRYPGVSRPEERAGGGERWWWRHRSAPTSLIETDDSGPVPWGYLRVPSSGVPSSGVSSSGVSSSLVSSSIIPSSMMSSSPVVASSVVASSVEAPMYRGIPSLKWISGFGLDRLSGEAVESDGVSLARQRKRYSKKDDDSTSLPADIFTEARDLPTLFMNGSTAPVFAKSSLQGQQDLASNAIRLPSDALIGKQWYLYGPSQGVEYGANVIDAWAASVLIARKRASGVSFPWHRAASLPPLVGPLDIVGDVGEGAGRGAGELQLAAAPIEFKEVLRAAPGLTVAIADSGCATNEDLVRKLAWSGGCPKKAKTDGFGRCLGYDYGNESPDPTQSTESHGTQTAGLIAAESDNHWGIAATCPNCKLICIKIFNDETRTLSTTAIVRALEHIAKSGAKVSNHSYGGFGDDRLERYAFERLLGKGDHLAFVAAGNAGCNIDCRGKKNCAGKRCPNTQLWTPASYNLPGLISIASNTKKGSVSMFSNVGPSSVQIFTPGSEIVSIDKSKLPLTHQRLSATHQRLPLTHQRLPYRTLQSSLPATLFVSGGSPTGTVGSGTSFASPIAAGIAAFVWSVIPEATAAQVQNAILTTARHNPQFEGLSRVPGILDAYNVLVKLANLV